MVCSMTEFAQVRYDYKVASVAFEVSLIRLQRERIQMVLLRERGTTQPEIADVTGVSLPEHGQSRALGL
jgi:hypothetical protein